MARAVVAFNCSEIPNDVDINGAELAVYMYGNCAGYDKDSYYRTYKVTTDWEESQSNWSTPWSKKGGDYAATAIDTYESKGAVNNVWYTFTVTATVKEFLSNPDRNYGFIIIAEPTDVKIGQQESYFRSSEYSTVSERPKLTITYDSGTNIVPEKLTIVPGKLYHVTVTNIQGRVVASYKTTNPNKLLVKNISPGIHFAVIEFDNSIRRTIKFSRNF